MALLSAALPTHGEAKPLIEQAPLSLGSENLDLVTASERPWPAAGVKRVPHHCKVTWSGATVKWDGPASLAGRGFRGEPL